MANDVMVHVFVSLFTIMVGFVETLYSYVTSAFLCLARFSCLYNPTRCLSTSGRSMGTSPAL